MSVEGELFCKYFEDPKQINGKRFKVECKDY